MSVGSKAMQSADAERTVALSVSSRWVNHSIAAKLRKNGLAFLSMRSRFLEKNLSSSSKALIVIAPCTDSARWLATTDLVVPLIRINSLAEAK